MRLNEFEYPVIIPLFLILSSGITGAINYQLEISWVFFVISFVFLIVFAINLPHIFEEKEC